MNRPHAAARRGLATALALSAALACTALLPRPPARVSVEVLPGFARLPALAQDVGPPLVLLLDVTLSMGRGPSPGAPPFESARRSAGILLDAAPENAPVSLRVLGIASGGGCGPAVPVKGPRSSARLAALSPVLRPRSEGSLAGALQAVAEERTAAPVAEPDARVVVLSDGGGLPDCVQKPSIPEGPGRLIAASAVVHAPAFSVEGAAPTREGGGTRASGIADGSAVSIAPGPSRIVVALDPPLVVGPLELRSGARARLRILEFPAQLPPRWEVFLVRDGAQPVLLPEDVAASAGSPA